MTQKARAGKTCFTSRAFGRAGVKTVKTHIAALAVVCALNLFGGIDDVAATPQNLIEGKITRDGDDLFYKIVAPPSGDYVLLLSAGPSEDIHSMQGVADELCKKYRCFT